MSLTDRSRLSIAIAASLAAHLATFFVFLPARNWVKIGMSSVRAEDPSDLQWSSSLSRTRPNPSRPLDAAPVSRTQAAGGRPSRIAAATRPASASVSGAGMDSYFLRLRRRIQERVRYPASLQRLHIEGAVEIEITLEPSGHARMIRIGKSSGIAALDRVALDSARAAAPFEPYDISAGTRQVRIPIDFHVRY